MRPILVAAIACLAFVAPVHAATLEQMAGQMIVVGFDGSNDARDAILAGKMRATVLQPALRQAQFAVELADQFLRTGKTGQPEKLLMDCFLIDRSNATQLKDFGLNSRGS